MTRHEDEESYKKSAPNMAEDQNTGPLDAVDHASSDHNDNGAYRTPSVLGIRSRSQITPDGESPQPARRRLCSTQTAETTNCPVENCAYTTHDAQTIANHWRASHGDRDAEEHRHTQTHRQTHTHTHRQTTHTDTHTQTHTHRQTDKQHTDRQTHR